VSAIGPGQTNIQITVRLSSGYSTLNVTVMVSNLQPAKITIAPSSTKLVVGQSKTLTATVYDASGNLIPGMTVVWNPTGPISLAQDATGAAITATGSGTATVTAYVGNASAKATINITEPVEYQATFLADVTVPDMTQFAPGATFTKTWAVRNTGTAAWKGVTLQFTGGTHSGNTSQNLASVTSVAVPKTAPGNEAYVSVPMTAPLTTGIFYSYWQFVSPGNTDFSIRYANIRVVNPPVIIGITPAAPLSGPSSQRISITGANLSPASAILKVGGQKYTLQGSAQIQPDTGNACSIVATLSMPGTYTLTLVNSDGSQSLPFAFTVVSGIAPVVTAVNPASPLMSTSLVPFAVIGSGFSTTVNAELKLNGRVYSVPRSQVIDSSATNIDLLFQFPLAGNWTVSIINSDGSTSNDFPFTVVASTNSQMAAYVRPTAGTVNVDGFTVTGSGATPGKTVTMTRMRIEGGAAVTATITADSQGGFVSGPTVETLAGTYTELWVDATTHASTNVA
jgi:hypothetical protein